MAVAVGVDVGGTKLLATSVEADGEVVERRRLTSPRGDADALVGLVADACRELGGDLPVGVGVAGIVGRDGVLRYGPNLEVADVPLRARLEEELGVPVTVRNDATVALYGEVRAGAARGSADVVLLTLGTGVGGAILADGRLVEGTSGMGGELGHVVVSDGGRACPCGSHGCLEVYASGSAIGLTAQERLDADTGRTTSLRKVDRVDGKAVTLAALEGDAFAVEVLREVGYWLGVGLVSLVNALDPETVVIGGGAAPPAAPIILPVAVDVLSARLVGVGHRPLPSVVVATLGDDAGAVGAALLAHDELSR